MGRTILLADDSLTIQKVVELTFADTEYEVVAVSSGDDLLQRLAEIQPDIVICDIIMPGRDGYEVCQEIKSDPATLHIPVILLSGTFEPFDRDRALAAGCSDIITKPFEARKLVETVERLLAPGTAEPAAAPISRRGAATAPTVFEPELSPVFVEPVPKVSDRVPEAGRPTLELTENEFAPEQGLDFTDTGFSEMEGAGLAQEQEVGEALNDGLDFEFSDEFEAFGLPGEGPDAASQDTLPEVALPSGARAPLGPEFREERELADRIEDEVWGDEPPSPEPFPEAPFESTFGPAPVATATPEPFGPGEEGAERGPVEPPPPDTPFFSSDEAAEPIEISAEPIPPPEALDDLDVAPLEVKDVAEGPFQPDMDASAMEADTAPVPPRSFREVPPPPAELIELPAAKQVGELSDRDIDRIARRVLELAAQRIEHIAWEVVPDMAEIVVRQRIRELEAEVDRSEPDGPPQ